MTEINNNELKFIKAFLCAGGFEEHFRTNSPTCSCEGLCIAFCFISSNQWVLNLLHVKTDFLQGKAIKRTIYIRPLKEANTTKLLK